MKTAVSRFLLAALSMQTHAAPSAALIDACLRTESNSPSVRYAPIDVRALEIIEDQEERKTSTVLRHRKDTVGIWEVSKPPTFGLVLNGKETPLAQVIRLNKRDAPTAFSPYEAMWGEAQEGKQSFICATFNFAGLGQSGSFQNVRGLYIFERGKRGSLPFYAVGNIAKSGK